MDDKQIIFYFFVAICLLGQRKLSGKFTAQIYRCFACLREGDMGVYGIAVLGFFSYGISVISILTCGIAVSSSSAVCGFSSFWLTVFGEDCSRYCSRYYGTVYLRFPFDKKGKTKHSR